MPEGVKWRRRTLCRRSAALSVMAVLGSGGQARAEATTAQAATPPAANEKSTDEEPATEKKPARPKVEKVEKTRAESLLGQPVLDGKQQTIGHVVDVLIDTEGNPHAAVIEFAGFLGVGDRKVAVAWNALHFALKGDRIVISIRLDPKALRAMPEYNASAKSVPVAAPAHPGPGPAKGR